MSIVLPEGGVIRGVGTDLIECERIARVLERQRDRFLKRVFTEGEREYSMKMKNPVPHLAARFKMLYHRDWRIPGMEVHRSGQGGA